MLSRSGESFSIVFLWRLEKFSFVFIFLFYLALLFSMEKHFLTGGNELEVLREIPEHL